MSNDFELPAERPATVHLAGRTYLVNPKNSWDTAPRCAAKTRSGEPCLNPARENGRCRMHGGNSTGPLDIESHSEIMRRVWQARRSGEAYEAQPSATPGQTVARLEALINAQLYNCEQVIEEAAQLNVQPPDVITADLNKLARMIERCLHMRERYKIGEDATDGATLTADEASAIRLELAARIGRIVNDAKGA